MNSVVIVRVSRSSASAKFSSPVWFNPISQSTENVSIDIFGTRSSLLSISNQDDFLSLSISLTRTNSGDAACLRRHFGTALTSSMVRSQVSECET